METEFATAHAARAFAGSQVRDARPRGRGRDAEVWLVTGDACRGAAVRRLRLDARADESDGRERSPLRTLRRANRHAPRRKGRNGLQPSFFDAESTRRAGLDAAGRRLRHPRAGRRCREPEDARCRRRGSWIGQLRRGLVQRRRRRRAAGRTSSSSTQPNISSLLDRAAARYAARRRMLASLRARRPSPRRIASSTSTFARAKSLSQGTTESGDQVFERRSADARRVRSPRSTRSLIDLAAANIVPIVANDMIAGASRPRPRLIGPSRSISSAPRAGVDEVLVRIPLRARARPRSTRAHLARRSRRAGSHRRARRSCARGRVARGSACAGWVGTVRPVTAIDSTGVNGDRDPRRRASGSRRSTRSWRTTGPSGRRVLLDRVVDGHARLGAPRRRTRARRRTSTRSRRPGGAASPATRSSSGGCASIVRWNAMAMVLQREQGVLRARRPHRQLPSAADALRGRLQPLLARADATSTAATSSTSRATRRPASTRAPSSRAASPRSSCATSARRSAATG